MLVNFDRNLQLSRNTVKIYLERFNASSFSYEQLLKMDDAGFYAIAYASTRQLQPEPKKEHFLSGIDYFLAELKRTSVTRHLLWKSTKKTTLRVIAIRNFVIFLCNTKKYMKPPCILSVSLRPTPPKLIQQKILCQRFPVVRQ
jgi:hypothetical protein